MIVKSTTKEKEDLVEVEHWFVKASVGFEFQPRFERTVILSHTESEFLFNSTVKEREVAIHCRNQNCTNLGEWLASKVRCQTVNV